ncbi:MAG: family 16 glycosylhydrolase [Micromonosporaceae bacterium]|nr:family 16 glycosylhydrolase [Micromonosporaceae bacterium]
MGNTPSPPRRRRAAGRTCAGLAAAALLVATLPAAATAAPAPAAPAAASAPQQLVFADEFSGPAGSPPDSSNWNHDVGGGGWGNAERQFYTTSTANAAHDGQGHLVITAREENPSGLQCWYGPCRYTSARLLTAGLFTQAFGRFEARIQIPRGQGLWPAFWLLGDDIGQVGWPQSGEIDIMENVGREPSTVHGTLHGPGYSGGGGVGGSFTLPGDQAFADGFHVFAIDWSPNSITWSVDGQPYQTRTPADLGGNEWVFDHPFFIIINVAVGGTFPGDPDGSTQFPQRMVVDYVRVDDGGGAGDRVGPITGLDGACVDVAGAGTANGTAVQLWTCNGTAAQRWTVGLDGTIRALGKCLDVAAGGTANGTVTQLWDCNGTGAQQWQEQPGGRLVNPQSGSCLDATDVSSAPGTRLQIWDCHGGANQVWQLPG